MNDPISAREFHDTPGVEGWRVVGDGACSYFPTSSFEKATRLVEAIGRLPDIEEHQPDIDIRPDGVLAAWLDRAGGFGLVNVATGEEVLGRSRAMELLRSATE